MKYQVVISQEKNPFGEYIEKRYKKSLQTKLHYHFDTPDKIIDILDYAHDNDIRLRFYYGDSKTGLDWGENHYIKGYVGKSTGQIKIPLVIYNKRSFGGISLMDHCLVKIETTKNHQLLYVHPYYHTKSQQNQPEIQA